MSGGGSGYGYAKAVSAGITTIIALEAINYYTIKDNTYNNNVHLHNSKCDETSSDTITFIDILNNDLNYDEDLKEMGKTRTDLLNMLKDVLGISALTDFYNSDKKVLCIGRYIDKDTSEIDIRDMRQYQNYAAKHHFWSFYMPKVEYDDIIAKNDEALFNLANDFLVSYCCHANWDFILVTNPYYYIEEHFDGKYYGYAYANELKIIRSHGYNYFKNTIYNWQNLPDPKGDYLEFAGFRVGR